MAMEKQFYTHTYYRRSELIIFIEYSNLEPLDFQFQIRYSKSDFVIVRNGRYSSKSSLVVVSFDSFQPVILQHMNIKFKNKLLYVVF